VEVLPLGIKEGLVGNLIFSKSFNPASLNEQELKLISDLVWKKKKIDPEKEQKSAFDFTNIQSLKVEKSKIETLKRRFSAFTLIKEHFEKLQPKNCLFEISISENKSPVALSPTILS
jgi:hypothetical protein